MDQSLSDLRINADRMRADFEALARIGATGDGGVNRPSLSEAHLEARRWFKDQVLAAGFEFQIDGAGNHSARLQCACSQAAWLLLGSHLDSVPYGGRFDGALGVLSALEVLRVIKDASLSLDLNLEAIDFTDEEGTLVGLLGSRALAGSLDMVDLREPRGGREALERGLARAGLALEGLFAARRNPEHLAGYLELHIEQGPRLVSAGADLGVVTDIVGITSCRLTFTGRADHAGTTPMVNRQDAALGAAAFILAVYELVQDRFPNGVANVGALELLPGAFNIVPERAVLSLEFRAPQEATLAEMERALLQRAQAEVERFDLGLEVEFLGRHGHAAMSAEVRDAFLQAAQLLGLKSLELSSGAGHDAQSLARVCPSGMVFVPSVGGASHSPREFTAWQDCVNGANALLLAALQLASEKES